MTGFACNLYRAYQYIVDRVGATGMDDGSGVAAQQVCVAPGGVVLTRSRCVCLTTLHRR